MALDRGRLAKIDRRVFAELDHYHGTQMVKVPVSDAVWSTWRRYCDALGMSMGEGVARLILCELETVVDSGGARTGIFTDQMSRQVEERASDLDARQRVLDARAEQLLAKEEHLKAWEQRMRIPRPAGGRIQSGVKVGRDERCPCGSGLTYKQCHGLPGRQV